MRWRRRIFAGLCALVVITALGLVWLVEDDLRANVRVAAERATGNTPELSAAAYVSALTDRDESLALARWSLAGSRSDALDARRAALTHRLLGTRTHQVRTTQWWSTCCEPSITTPEYAKYAGFARLTVDLDGAPYVFDILAPGQVDRFHDTGAPRTWVIHDVYPAGEQPLFWTWPGR